MLFNTALLGGLFLAGHAAATTGSLNAVLQPANDVEDVLRRDADLVASLTQRQDANGVGSAPQISTTPASGDASQADLEKWSRETKAACQTALGSLNGQASNPSGIAVCYNVPFLDNRTGVFQAELRMYNVSAPINPWVGVTAAEVSMTLSYLGATVQNMNGTFQKREEVGYPPIRAREEVDGMLVERQTVNTMTELKVLMYVGRINSNLMGPAMNEEALKPLLVPQIDLAARNPTTNQDVSATLSSGEASFVNGVFAKATNGTRVDDAEAAASASAAVVKAAPFFLPGTNLAFFPIGLVITSIWTAGFLGAVGLGTMGRIQFREQYRRRVRAEMSRGVRTI